MHDPKERDPSGLGRPDTTDPVQPHTPGGHTPVGPRDDPLAEWLHDQYGEDYSDWSNLGRYTKQFWRRDAARVRSMLAEP